ncbi:glycosyltransferase family 2 protein [Nocardioides sp. YIM 152315]|uniref:glycosyltransferase family 2 protein n=1 Tax=Nocardioides sp. YIM 152315 TaxID=3031760 RepID=UPI0023DBE953|nr:glycosyltransferase family 2 protein [Nocardioides sp. YIM 152315]MDF1605222.1 glycosyltransferase family 2 protein [Nocardioides sp. YIM 152315]
MPETPSLSFVVICHNAEELVETALARLCTAIERAEWPQAEVVVVDDGSTDRTAEVVASFAARTDVRVRLHSQPNGGRLVASRNGVGHATGELVSFIGERVWMHPDALVNLRQLMAEHPEARVWNCHIDIPRDGNRQAQFWYVLTYLGWRRYLANPRLISFGTEDFDYYPKGTGGFVCPRDLLLDGYAGITSLYDDERNSSDDTALIRWIAERERIWMSPAYSAEYVARSTHRDFVRHARQRGTLLLDSYFSRGTRLHKPLIAYFVLSPLAVLAVLRRPRLLLALPAGLGVVAAVLRRLGVERRDVVGFSLFAPVFGAVFSVGLWRGLLDMARSRVWRRRSLTGGARDADDR